MKKLPRRFEAIPLKELPKNIVPIEAEMLPPVCLPKVLERRRVSNGGHRIARTQLKKVVRDV